jgi:hypothetical protein
MRVQVKSTSGTGYFCQFRRNYLTKHLYIVEDVDLFAAYIIPVSTWYLIPAAAGGPPFAVFEGWEAMLTK